MSFLANSLSVTSSSRASSIPLLLVATGAAVGLVTLLNQSKSKKHKKSQQDHTYSTPSASLSSSYSSSSDDDRIDENDGLHHTINITLPNWAISELNHYKSKTYTTDEEKMSLAIHLSAQNVQEQTGGPFGCAIFERNDRDGTAKLVSVGVNRVVALGNSTLHGEIVAIQLAQKKLKSFTMQLAVQGQGQDGQNEEEIICRGENDNQGPKKIRKFELFTSCEPCAMCLGATLWSGVSRIVCAATKSDAEAIGFDEGPVYEDSYDHLRKVGIEVKKLVLQHEAAQVLRNYGANGLIYN